MVLLDAPRPSSNHHILGYDTIYVLLWTILTQIQTSLDLSQLPNLGSFQPLFLQTLILVLFSLLSWDSNDTSVRFWLHVSWVPETVSVLFFPSLFCLCLGKFLDSVKSVDLFFVISLLLLNPSYKFCCLLVDCFCLIFVYFCACNIIL